MTVAAGGEREGTLAMVERESGLNTDTPVVELSERAGRINGNLKIGADITAVQSLMANELISSPGVKLHGSGFIVTPEQASALGLGATPGLEDHILPYRHGRDIAQRPRGVKVIDLYPLSADEVRDPVPKGVSARRTNEGETGTRSKPYEIPTRELVVVWGNTQRAARVSKTVAAIHYNCRNLQSIGFSSFSTAIYGRIIS